MAKQGSNKARNQLRDGGQVNATWLEKNKAQRRRRSKLARKSRQKNRK